MKFKNKNHQALFNTAANKLNRHDKTKMALLYLLTADVRLWNMAKHHVKKGYIDLDSIDLGNKGYPKAYTLLGVAKDIANGTSYHVTYKVLTSLNYGVPQMRQKLFGWNNNF